MSDELDKDLVVCEFFTMKLWLLDFPGVRRLTGATIKVEPNGYLMVLKGITEEGKYVAFLGKSTLVGLYRCLQSVPGRASLRWREDQY